MSKLRLVRKEGGSRVISIREIPADWQAIELTVTKESEKSLTIKIDRIK